MKRVRRFGETQICSPTWLRKSIVWNVNGVVLSITAQTREGKLSLL